jgi:hypothetical protein
VGLKLNQTLQLVVCADDVNLLEDNINTINKITEASIDGSKEVCLEVSSPEFRAKSCHKDG